MCAHTRITTDDSTASFEESLTGFIIAKTTLATGSVPDRDLEREKVKLDEKRLALDEAKLALERDRFEADKAERQQAMAMQQQQQQAQLELMKHLIESRK